MKHVQFGDGGGQIRKTDSTGPTESTFQSSETAKQGKPTVDVKLPPLSDQDLLNIQNLLNSPDAKVRRSVNSILNSYGWTAEQIEAFINLQNNKKSQGPVQRQFHVPNPNLQPPSAAERAVAEYNELLQGEIPQKSAELAGEVTAVIEEGVADYKAGKYPRVNEILNARANALAFRDEALNDKGLRDRTTANMEEAIEGKKKYKNFVLGCMRELDAGIEENQDTVNEFNQLMDKYREK